MCTFPAWHSPDSPTCTMQASLGRALLLAPRFPSPGSPIPRVFLAGAARRVFLPQCEGQRCRRAGLGRVIHKTLRVLVATGVFYRSSARGGSSLLSLMLPGLYSPSVSQEHSLLGPRSHDGYKCALTHLGRAHEHGMKSGPAAPHGPLRAPSKWQRESRSSAQSGLELQLPAAPTRLSR